MVSDSPFTLKPLPDADDALILSVQLSSYIGISSQTLAHWRMTGVGPKYVKMGKAVAYKAGEVRTWLSSCEKAATCEKSNIVPASGRRKPENNKY